MTCSELKRQDTQQDQPTTRTLNAKVNQLLSIACGSNPDDMVDSGVLQLYMRSILQIVPRLDQSAAMSHSLVITKEWTRSQA